ncbi:MULTISPECIES: TfoX/Sxy family DNA transformation protein [unclassified Symbiopectobacterium]|uniref:TfoX/Sxy family DNA transformation protein n=1 Tax=unclassified Symbiopectobacterium TaxID=2794573 RepID=UPI0022269488|nr:MULTISPECIES: TfoX/Sxy family DNA transformation protein [unclassified Symbiopectobacterium]MCW2474336.1 TfoX/Sxy family DNA transformation protein [Candidatus Symbiopectobacterium sp. NZEC151]MCW2485577.1 TfoX/Sxy family DNA transformation protein [Candidatus Symbiopectobacterium sp. NZEC127]
MNQLCKKRILQSKVSFSSLGEITTRSQFGGYSIAANKTIFGLISNGELYLRASKRCEPHFLALNMPHLVYTKRGMPVPLSYYLVGEVLWEDPTQLLQLAKMSLEGAEQDKSEREHCTRLKDLPNLNHDLERMLWKAGIRNADELQQHGAKESYLKLKAVSKHASVNILLALAGAICRTHQAALPKGVRNELIEWYKHHSAPLPKT